MGGRGARGIALDAGALIALERHVRLVVILVQQAPKVHVPAGALAQVWRDPRRQVLLTRLIAAEETTVHPLDAEAAEAAGTLCGVRGTCDVIDASVVQVAQTAGCPVITGDPDVLRHLAPDLPIFAI